MEQSLILAAAWVAWCTLHSLLVSVSGTAWFKHRLGGIYQYQRLLFNIVAMVTLIPLFYLGWRYRGDPIFQWAGWLRGLQSFLIGVALVFFISGARQYDLKQFLGLRRLSNGDGVCATIGETCAVETKGVLGLVRHPWYSGGMIIIWARTIDAAALVTNLVLTAYFIVGTLLEEHRLVREMGEAYRRYQREVPMFVPWRWIVRKNKGSEESRIQGVK